MLTGQNKVIRKQNKLKNKGEPKGLGSLTCRYGGSTATPMGWSVSPNLDEGGGQSSIQLNSLLSWCNACFMRMGDAECISHALSSCLMQTNQTNHLGRVICACKILTSACFVSKTMLKLGEPGVLLQHDSFLAVPRV